MSQMGRKLAIAAASGVVVAAIIARFVAYSYPAQPAAAVMRGAPPQCVRQCMAATAVQQRSGCTVLFFPCALPAAPFAPTPDVALEWLHGFNVVVAWRHISNPAL